MSAERAAMPTVIVLASGRGERFKASGGQTHKLQALLEGKPVLERTLDAVRASGLPWHLEDRGLPGMGDSISAAVQVTREASGWLILPGDLPLVQPATLQRVAKELMSGRHNVVIPRHQGQRGHPVGFAAGCAEALIELSGDGGAARVIALHSSIEIEVPDIGVVTDIDTLDALRHAEAQLAARAASRSTD